ncbi:GDSL-type esterase/lipase family protein [Paracoccus luteus]|uniref:GDSL-type esterase/lipase family protein n=1 Tax=Paracoccus luteus TaxID=2508543 RepID=UPI00106F1769|nr:GDSL-type esterase/lipase family protein [Paracoccus luteus]
MIVPRAIPDFAARPAARGRGGIAIRLALALAVALPSAARAQAARHEGWTEAPMRIQGRVAARDGKLLHQWPAIRAEAEFAGPAAALALTDSPARYRVTIDGGGPAPRVVTLDRPATGTLDLDAPGPGPHRLLIETLGETPGEPGVLPRLLVPDAAAVRPPPPPPPRRIEVIGDSDSTGHGILHDGRDCDAATTEASSDSTAAWPAQLARTLGADLRLHAATGVGLIRNYGGAAPDRTMPAIYPRTLWADTVAPPDPADAWRPQLIVVAIGSNDFASPLQPDERWDGPRAIARDFAPALADFLAGLRDRAPDAAILLAVWPEYGRPYMRAHRAALDLREDAGDDAVALVSLPRMDKTACGWHPSAADHAAISATIAAYLAAAPPPFP